MRKFRLALLSASSAVAALALACSSSSSDASSSANDGGAIDGATNDTGSGGDTSTPLGDGGSNEAGVPGTVTGVVKGLVPFPNVTVLLDGVAKTTDANGSFVFTDAPATYTLTVIFAPQGTATAPIVDSFVGVTTRTPIILDPYGAPNLHSDATKVSVAATGTIPTGDALLAVVTGNAVESSGEPSLASLFPGQLDWKSADDLLSVDIYAFVMSSNPAQVVSYGADFAFPLAPPDGGVTTAPTIAMAAAGAMTTISGTYTVPASFTPNVSVPKPCRLLSAPNGPTVNVGSFGAGGTFTCAIPTSLLTLKWVPIIEVVAFSSGPGGYPYAQKAIAVPTGTGTFAVTVDTPSALTAPADSATSVDLTKPITWTLPTTTDVPVHALTVSFTNGTDFNVYSTGIGSTILPNLSAYGVTFGASGDAASARILEYDNNTVDTLLDGVTDTDDYAAGASLTSTFTIK